MISAGITAFSLMSSPAIVLSTRDELDKACRVTKATRLEMLPELQAQFLCRFLLQEVLPSTYNPPFADRLALHYDIAGLKLSLSDYS